MSGHGRRLTRYQIDRIETFRIHHCWDVVQLKLAMRGAPFNWPTLFRALSGKPIREATYRFLVRWIEQVSPQRAVPDGKAAAAGKDRETVEPVPCSE
jgi:hypothetical protein